MKNERKILKQRGSFSKMRKTIISEIDGDLKKLVWVMESKEGVYMGFYGLVKDTHQSYHKSGIVHDKRGSRYFPTYKGTPISEITEFAGAHCCSISFDLFKSEYNTGDYKGLKNADDVIYVNPEIIQRLSILNIYSFIIKKRERSRVSLKNRQNL